MRDSYVRHRSECRYASLNSKNSKRVPPRLIFGCGCPIYARLLVRHPDPTVAPFEFNGSLTKLGVKEKLAAEELIERFSFSLAAEVSTRTNSKQFSKGSRIT